VQTNTVKKWNSTVLPWCSCLLQQLPRKRWAWTAACGL